MIRYWLEKTWVQNAILISLAAFAIYYCGWVFDFGYEFKWSMLFTRNETYGVVMGAEILKKS